MSDEIGPQEGESWYIQLSPRSTLVKMRILELTEKTVLLKKISHHYSPASRYVITDIDFIERVWDDPPLPIGRNAREDVL